MGFNISGIAINKNFENNIDDLQRQLGLSLEFSEEIDFEKASENWKDENICDIYFTKNGTLLFLNHDICLEPWSIDNGNILTFAISETSMTFNLNYCEAHTLIRSFMDMNHQLLSEEGEKLEIENKTTDSLEIIFGQLKIVLGNPYASIKLSEKAYRYKLISVSRTNKVKSPINKKSESNVNINTVPEITKTIKITNDSLITENIFDKLISEDDKFVLETINGLTEDDINNHTLSYILNLSLFHRDSKVRKAANKQLDKFAPEDLLIQSKNNWKDSYLKNQEYIHKNLFEHPSINPEEYLVFSQVTRKNYFLVKPKTGMIPYVSSRYGDEIENIFDCYQIQLEKVSDKISKLKHITVANFRKQPKLDIKDTIEKLSKLPNLNFLQIADSDLKELPSNINKLVNLKTLIIEKNPISELPKEIVFQNLEKLDIKFTNISTIDIRQFPNLKELWIDDKKRLDTLKFKNIDHDFIGTSGQLFSQTINKQTEKDQTPEKDQTQEIPKINKPKWKFW